MQRKVLIRNSPSSAIPVVTGTLLSMNVSGIFSSANVAGTFTAVTALLPKRELHFELHFELHYLKRLSYHSLEMIAVTKKTVFWNLKALNQKLWIGSLTHGSHFV